MTIQTVRTQRLHEGLGDKFRALIQEGSLKPGDRLPSERVLAEQFQVSRSSVREAIRSLELQGLVVSKRGSGTFINTDNLESMAALIASTLSAGNGALKHIFEMRHILEPQIAALAAQRADQEQIHEMERILETQSEEIRNGRTGADADTAFHFSLAAATQNSALMKLVSAVEDILHRSRHRSFQEPGRPQRSLESHRNILKMVQLGDADGARRAMEHHLTMVEPATASGD